MKKVICVVLAMMASACVYAGGPDRELTARLFYDWTGFYVGANAGGIWGKANLYDVNEYNGTDVRNFNYNPDGGLVALHFGYENLLGRVFLLGAEAQGGWISLKGSRQYPPYIGVRGSNDSVASTNDGGFFSLVGRFGFVAWQRILFYGKGGWAWTGISNTFIDTDPEGITLSNTTSPKRNGSVFGGGIEYAFTNDYSGRVEYGYYNFGTVTSSGLAFGDAFHFNHKLTAKSVTLSVSRKF